MCDFVLTRRTSLRRFATRRAFTVVIAQHEKQRSRIRKLTEEVTLRKVLWKRIGIGFVFVGHEGVAHVDHKIGIVSALVGEGLQINIDAGVRVEM
ncbi:MAG: hypothetical protein IPP55_19395 [Anaerolineales bacterium]|nr:hypothetical protein [Anaerolineales bacterium]